MTPASCDRSLIGRAAILSVAALITAISDAHWEIAVVAACMGMMLCGAISAGLPWLVSTAHRIGVLLCAGLALSHHQAAPPQTIVVIGIGILVTPSEGEHLAAAGLLTALSASQSTCWPVGAVAVGTIAWRRFGTKYSAERRYIPSGGVSRIEHGVVLTQAVAMTVGYQAGWPGC
jgi:hypothetical protein